MPNNPHSEYYTLIGPQSLLEAAYKEIKEINYFKEKGFSQEDRDTLRLSLEHKEIYWAYHRATTLTTVVLTLPQDWNTFMDILEELKKPQVPEYVKLGNRVGKVYSTSHTLSDSYLVYTTYGKKDEWCQSNCTPIKEKEFIQGGLKELEEAGFVKGAKVKAGKESKGFTIHKLQYITSKADFPTSTRDDIEWKEKGFSFSLQTTGGGSIPVGECTLFPTLPTTSQGIPYVVVKDQVIFTPQTPVEINKGSFKYWERLGVTSITLPFGTLTGEDLKQMVA